MRNHFHEVSIYSSLQKKKNNQISVLIIVKVNCYIKLQNFLLINHTNTDTHMYIEIQTGGSMFSLENIPLNLLI